MAWTLEGSASAPASDLSHGSTFAYTVNAASTLLVIGGSSNVTGVTPTITYDGMALTWITLDDVVDSSQVCLGYLLSPPTGTHNFANPAAIGNGSYFIADYSGISGVTATNTNSQLTGTNLTTSLTAASGDLAIAAVSTAHLGTTFVTPTSNMTLLGQDQSFLSCGMYNSTSALTAGTFGAVTETSGSDRQYTAVATFTIGGGAFTASLSESASAVDAVTETRPFQGLGDIYTGVFGYWGLRAMDATAAATGLAAIQLTRASDMATMDIDVLSTGVLDTSTAATFIGTSSARVTKWYDQSGNGYHHVAPSFAQAPLYVANGGNGKPAIAFNGDVGQFFEYTAGIPNTVSPVLYSHYTLPQMTGVRNTDYMPIDSADGGNQFYQLDGSGNQNFGGFFSSSQTTTITNDTWIGIQHLVNVGTNLSNIDINGTSNAVTYSVSSGTNILSGSNAIGCDLASPTGPYADFFNGLMQEMAVFDSAPTTTVMGQAYANQLAFWGTTTALTSVSLVESAFATDAPSTTLPLAEAASAGETWSFVFGRSVALTDTLSATDTISAAGIFTASLSEAASASDSPAYTYGVSVTYTDVAAAAETLGSVYGVSISLSESGTASEVLGTGGDFALSLTESASAADSPSITGATFSATLVEMASAQDSPTVSFHSGVDLYQTFVMGRERTAGTGGLASVVASITVLVGQGASPTQAAVETMALDMAAFTEYNPQAALFVNVDTTVIVSVSVLREFFNFIVRYAAGAGMKP